MKLPDLNRIKNKFEKLSDLQKKIAIGLLVFVIVDIFAFLILFINKNKSSVHLECFGTKNVTSLIALDENARNGVVKQNQFADFKFTENQKAFFENIYKENGTVALTIRLVMMPNKAQKEALNGEGDYSFKYGFLNSDDFTSKGKFIQQVYPNNRRILVQGDWKKAPETFDVSFAIQKSDDISHFIPEGFFVYSNIKCKVMAACVVPAEIGFDLTSTIPYYGFACTGGIVDFENTKIDYSGASMVFPVQNSSLTSMPEFVISFSSDPELKTTNERTIRTEINIGGEKLFVNNVKAASEIVIPTGGLKAPFARLEVMNNEECITSIIMRSTQLGGKSDSPIRTDPGLILTYKSSNWRTLDYEVFEWDRFPGILFFDTRNYDVQDKFFQRMAFFVEKEGYRGKLWTNEQLAGKHAYNAHDYSAESMAKFFNLAAKTDFTLNKEEIILKQILLKNGLFTLEEDGVTVKANEGGLVSISQETADWSRRRLLAHEGWHTLFFRDPDFRNYVSAVYYTMDSECLQFLKDYFKSQPSLGYDQTDDYLMHNEFMAYIMQQPLKEVGQNFVNWANWGTVMKQFPQTSKYVRDSEGRGFEDAAIALNEYVFDNYGIVCGNIALVSK